ncbi:MAG TPA: hypothetical protein VFT53_03350 [Candidatus Saccharimonadales bacterium]|nr:hypothetical protein [Candidatus Saccharimonadales bacterium]
MGLRIGFGQTRRFACVVLAACLVFSAIGSLSLPEPVFAFSGGTGTSSDPYQITTAADLAGISAYLGSGNASKYFKLMNNIDLSAYSTGSGWTPLGAYPNYFYGHFDGNYKTISNLYVNSSGTSYVGLFGYVGTGGVIQNTTLSNVNVTGAIDVGALAGENNGTVQQSGVSGGTVTGTERVGGLVGSNQGAMAYDYANVSVTFNPPVASASCCSGGLAGEAFGSTAATIHDSYSRSSVYIGVATPYDQGSVGGLLGNDYNSGSKSNLYSTGPVTVVSGSLPSGTGGLSGGQYTSIASSYWDTQSSGLATSMGGAGVVGETTAAMKTQSTYSGWDFTTIWAIDGSGTINNGYPYLQWQANTSSNPNTPSALGPAGVVGGGYGTSSQPVFSFTLSDPNGSATVKYEIQIDTSGTFASPVVDYTSALGSQGSFGFTVGQAAGSGTYAAGSAGQTLADGAYYWRVKTIDNSNNSSGFSSANAGGIAFKVDATPPVTPGTPAGAASQTPATDTDWTWTASSDSGSGLASPAYTVQWSQDSSFATGLHTATSATNALAIGSLADGMWYVRVRAADGAGNNSAYSPAGNVLVDTTAPSIPGRPTPATATTDTTPVWAWTASSDTGSGLAATPYTVEWSQDAGFTSGVSSAVAGSHAFTMPSALADGTWYLRVKAEDAVGNFSPYSAAGSIVLARGFRCWQYRGLSCSGKHRSG